MVLNLRENRPILRPIVPVSSTGPIELFKISMFAVEVVELG